MRIIFSITLLLSFGICWGQSTFFRTYGTNSWLGNGVVATSDGGYALTGNTYGPIGGMDIYILKTNALGDTSWSKTYGTIHRDEGTAIEETSDGGFIISGYTGEPDTLSEGLSDIFVIKTNATGDSIWSFSWNPGFADRAYDVKETKDSSFIITGVKNSGINIGDSAPFLAKLSNDGDMIWSNSFEGPGVFESIIQTLDGGYIACGRWGFPARPLLVKTNAIGDTVWTRRANINLLSERYEDIVQLPDSNFIITGIVYNNGRGDVLLTKINQYGNMLWTKYYGGDNDDYGLALDSDLNNGFIITGTTFSYAPGPFRNANIWVIKTDENGDPLWTQTYGGSDDEEGFSVQSSVDGGAIITGYAGPSRDIFLLKIDSLGNAPILTSVNNVPSKSEPSMQVFPNPVEDIATIEFEISKNITDVQFTIIDYLGRAVQYIKQDRFLIGKNYKEINVADLQSGTYFLRISANSYSQLAKFVKY